MIGKIINQGNASATKIQWEGDIGYYVLMYWFKYHYYGIAKQMFFFYGIINFVRSYEKVVLVG